MNASPTFIWVDVSKAHLDCACRPSADVVRVTNDLAEIEVLIERIQRLAPALIVLEATGNFQMEVVVALAAAGLRVAVVNPRQVRDFAKATGQLAKTDTIDAHVLAHFVEAVQPEVRPLPYVAVQMRAEFTQLVSDQRFVD